jgi:hypothetical protein
MVQLRTGKVVKVHLILQLRFHNIVCRNLSRLSTEHHRLFHPSCNDLSVARGPGSRRMESTLAECDIESSITFSTAHQSLCHSYMRCK